VQNIALGAHPISLHALTIPAASGKYVPHISTSAPASLALVTIGTKSVVPFDPFDEESREKLQLEEIYVPDWGKLILKPWQFILGATKERIWLPDDIVARVEWRSSIARLWILIHITWWFIDPWFWWHSPSTITLEIKNVNTVPVVLRPWMRICQIAFEILNAPAEVPYYKKKSAKYNGQIKPQESLIYLDSERNV